MVEYFLVMFGNTSNYDNTQFDLEYIPKIVKCADNMMLWSPITLKEVQIASFQMHPDKSPGLR